MHDTFRNQLQITYTSVNINVRLIVIMMMIQDMDVPHNNNDYDDRIFQCNPLTIITMIKIGWGPK